MAGFWLLVIGMSGVLAYGETQDDAISRVQALALRVVADILEYGELNRPLFCFPVNF
ncbi:hypothetical protein NG798_21670 [Ancylothrix sp. C2]|uniref:hypothetical protein n=1 Tax=Ancylothrix sp. D3o TaxID=2953691 RepID=UPI0021BABA8D|nr:hypothetical protein [Ancylothrix sp. D3o]MCT7952406.1 hypothetical protein [Ancylothrix sp. D3o]